MEGERGERGGREGGWKEECRGGGVGEGGGGNLSRVGGEGGREGERWDSA